MFISPSLSRRYKPHQLYPYPFVFLVPHLTCHYLVHIIYRYYKLPIAYDMDFADGHTRTSRPSIAMNLRKGLAKEGVLVSS